MLPGLEMLASPAGNGSVMRWEREQLQRSSGSESGLFPASAQTQQFQGLERSIPGLDEFGKRVVNSDLGNGWPGFGKLHGDGSGFGFGNGTAFGNSCAISRTVSCPPAAADTERRGPVLQGKLSCKVGKESFKKRKAAKNQCLKVVTEDHDTKYKKINGCGEEGESKITEHNSNKKNTAAAANKETSGDASKENSKVQKPDYIHVRARRGQATDSHSLAERARREKISERMKHLQDLVPGCNKITGKAGMLDEIINYVQSLQKQVEFLSMKLAAIIPSNPDFNVDTSFPKELIPVCGSSFPTIGVSSEMANQAYVQFNPTQELVSCCGSEMGINPPEMALRRTISAPVSMPETFLDSTCFNPSPAWDTDLQNFYGVEFHPGRSASLFPSQQFTGLVEGNNLKMGM